MKEKLSTSLENENVSLFPYLMEQIKSAVDNWIWENALKRSSYCKTHLKLLQDFCDFVEGDWILAFLNPFSLSE